MKKRYLILALIILSFVSIFIGVYDINFKDILAGNTDKIEVLLISRLPRLLSIIFAGVGLSVSGVIMQQISNNKFVSPTTAATIDSAKLGILFATLLFGSVTLMQKMIWAFVFAMIGTFIFMKILKKIKYKNAVFIPLLGIMLGNVIGSITDFLAYKFDMVQNMSSFMQGSFSGVLKGNYELMYLTVPLMIIALLYANKFTIIGMGEDISKNLGLDFNKVANIGISIVAMVSALVVITVGSIPFVGLIVPNIVSLRMGDNLSKNIWHIALFGAIFVLICDIIGRLIIYPYEIPISVTVGTIGSMVFLYLIFRRNKNE